MKNLMILAAMCLIGCGTGSGDVKQIPLPDPSGYHGEIDAFSCQEGYQLCDHVCRPQGTVCWDTNNPDAAVYQTSDSGVQLPLH